MYYGNSSPSLPSWILPPVSQDGLNKRQSGNGRRVGSHDPGAKQDPDQTGTLQQHRALVLGKTAFGADEDGKGRRGIVTESSKRCERVRLFCAFIAEDEEALGVELLDSALQRQRFADLRQGENAALLRCLDGIRPHAYEVDPRHLRVAGDDRLQPGGAEFHSLLNHVVEPGVL